MDKAQILVVEDDNIVVMELEDTLQNLGYAVSAVASYGEEAIEKAAERRPDLVLMDIRLKGDVNGIDAAEEIRERFDIPVVYLTAYADEDTLQRAKITEPYGYIVKPFEERELRSAIEMALYKHKMERKLKESEWWLATTLSSIGDAVIATDDRGLVGFMNPVAEALTGWKQEDAWGKDLTEVFNIIDEETREVAENPAARVIQEGIVVGLTDRSILLAKDGREIPIDDSVAPIIDCKRNIIGVVLVFRDITERKRAEKALRESEEELKAIFDGAGDGIALIDRMGRVIRVNKRIIEIGGYTEEEIVGKRLNLFKMFPPRSLAKMLPNFAKLISGQPCPPFHVEVYTKAGEELDVELRGSLLRKGGRIVGMVGVMRDITERERAEEEIRQRNRELAAINYELSLLLEASQAVSSSLELDEVLQIVAQKLTELAGAVCCRVALLDETGENLTIHGAYPTREALDWEPGIGQRYPVAASPWRQKVIDTGEPMVWHRDESPPLSEDELLVSLGAGVRAVALLPVFLRGQVAGVAALCERRGWERSPLDTDKIGLCQAIINEMVMAIENARLHKETVQRAEQIERAERHLAGVVESANDFVVSVDSEGRIATWNQTAERISGYTFSEVVGRRLGSLCEEEHQAAMEAMLAQVVLGERIEGTEMTLLTRAGNRIPVAWNCSPMRDEEGHVLGVVAVGRDLTERRRLEAQLIQSAKMASLGVMAGGIAHEIRNPLAVSSAAAQLLLEDPDDEQLRTECAEKMYSGISRAAVIVDNLLAFARPAEGGEEAVDINEALRQALTLFVHQTTRRGIAVHTEFSPELPSTEGNKNLLQQVFSNMILNACNAMPDGGRLTVKTQLNADNEVEIRFTDTGCGIPEENLGKLFDPFFTTMPVGKGTGLGLSLCYAIVGQHQGEIDVHSQVGVGSTFVVRLPVTEAGK